MTINRPASASQVYLGSLGFRAAGLDWTSMPLPLRRLSWLKTEDTIRHARLTLVLKLVFAAFFSIHHDNFSIR